MRTIFLECGMGAAGDMLSAALLELVPDRASALAGLNGLGIPGVEFSAGRVTKCGICGTQMTVRVNGRAEEEDEHSGHVHHCHEHVHEHEHSCGGMHVHFHVHSYAEMDACHGHHGCDPHAHGHVHADMAGIESAIRSTSLSESAKAKALDIYKIIASAESEVHGVPVSDIHFHEVGKLDAIADIVAVCYLMELLAPGKVIASPVRVGTGHVRCAHGILPVPAPAVALILRGLPVYGGDIEGEMCTPTGAALLKYFASSFGPMPEIRTESIGYGMGSRTFCKKDRTGAAVEVANCLRAFLGDA